MDAIDILTKLQQEIDSLDLDIEEKYIRYAIREVERLYEQTERDTEEEH